MKNLFQAVICKTTISLLIIIFLSSSLSLNLTAKAESSLSRTWDSQADFAQGTADANAEINQAPGDIRLKYKTTDNVDTTDADFAKGNTLGEGFSYTGISTDGGGGVKLNKSFSYTTTTVPAIGGNNVYSTWKDSATGLLYVSAAYGVSVIDTKNTPTPTDDETLITYNENSTPALLTNNDQSSDYVKSFIDPTTNYLYIVKGFSNSTTLNGLQVIDTKGTKTPTDDTFVTSYTRLGSAARLTDEDIMACEMDYASGLIYVIGNDAGSGIAVIDTKKTKDPSDDTSIKYTTTGVYDTTNGVDTLISATPKIRSMGQISLKIDNENHLIYLTVQDNLVAINTQGTADFTDDTSYAYTPLGIFDTTNDSTGTLLTDGLILPSSSIYSINRVNDLLYISTSKGLSVINTHGTPNPADDTLVKTYTTATTPAIGNNYVRNSFLDSTLNLIYISTYSGLSVINTQGTVDPADDTLVKTYTTATTPALDNNHVKSSFLDNTSNLLYASTYSGLSVIDLNDEYRPHGTFTKEIYGESENFWTNKASLPAVTMSAASGIIDGKLYIAGGTQDWTDTTEMNMYDPNTDIWTSKASLLESRVTPVSGVIDGKLYVAGGRDVDWNGMATLEIYDPNTNAWSTGASMHAARIGAAGGVYAGKLYVVGGTNTSGGTANPTLEIYDPNTNTWEYGAVSPLTKLTGATAQFINGKMYMAGGQTQSMGGDSNIISSYDPATDIWDTDLTLMPATRSGGSSVVLDGKFIYIGGTNSDWDTALDIYSYDPQTDTWGILSVLPQEIHRSMPFVVDGNLYVIGGRNFDWETINTNFFAAAKYFSDTYQKEIYNKINWTATVPAGTSVELLYSLDGGKNYTSLGTTASTYYLPTTSSYNFKYKAVLTTSDTAVTPSLGSVTVSYAEEGNNLFASNSATYTSQVIDATRTAHWQNLAASATTPTGTSVTYATRSGVTPTPDDSWSAWQQTTDGAVSSPDARYFQYQATLATTDPNQTPVISALTLNYELLTMRTVIDPTPQKMAPELQAGFISSEGADPTATPSFTFNVDFILQTGTTEVYFPAGTQVTRTGGGNLDLTQLITQNDTNLIQSQLNNVAGAIKIGIPNLNLTFSQPITVTIPVGTQYNNQTLQVVFQREGETDWNDETTCQVVNGNCVFQTNHATSFAVQQIPEEEKNQKAYIDSWKAFPYAKPDLKCVQRLQVELKGKHFANNAEVKIGNNTAFAVERKSSKAITAKFCLEKLLDIQTDLKRTISVINPDADREKADKKIDLAGIIAPAIAATPVVSNIVAKQTVVTPKQDTAIQPTATQSLEQNSPVPSKAVKSDDSKQNAQPQNQTQTFTWWNPLSWF